MRKTEKKFSIGSLFKCDVIKNEKSSLFISTHKCTAAFTDCCDLKKHGSVFKLLAEITYQFFISIALSIKFCRILLKFNIAHLRLRSLADLLYKSVKVSNNRVVCCILLVFMIPVMVSWYVMVTKQ